VSNEHLIDPESPFVFLESHRKEQAAAGALSLGLHLAGIFALWALLILIKNSPLLPSSSAIRSPIQLENLIWRRPASAANSGGGGGGDHSLVPVSRGAVPLVIEHRRFILPLLVTNPQAKLQVTPTFDAEAPKILADQYGDPLSASGVLSEGPGKGGIGSGTDGFGKGPGSGYGNGGPGGRVYGWNQVNTPPVLLLKVEPEYSEQARQSKFQGTVLLRVVIDEKGLPREIGVTRPLGLGLDEKAMEAVRRWRFKPATKDGKPVAMEAVVEVNFRLL
jgi:periplasmic protein TonB